MLLARPLTSTTSIHAFRTLAVTPRTFFTTGSFLSSARASPEQMASIKSTVDAAINDEFIAVFSKSYCPYCRKAKSLLNSLPLPAGKTIKVFELDEMDEGSDIQAYLHSKTGQRTVPNIFIKSQHIGGSDDLARAHSAGKLAELIKA